MPERLVPLKVLTPEGFAPYGRLLRLPPETTEAFHEVIKLDSPGWLLAYSKFSNRTLEKLGLHPNTKESFQPIAGVTVFCAAPQDRPEEIEAFLLDQPIVIHENVWHGMIALSPVSEVKIAENQGVIGKGHRLDPPIGVYVGR